MSSRLEHVTLPPSLRPLIRAYALGYITVTGPRLFGFLRVLSRRDVSLAEKLNLLYKIIKTSAEPNRFPTACAITVGGATVLPRLIKSILQWFVKRVSPDRLGLLGTKFVNRLRFVTTFLSACLAFNLLNRDPSWSRKRASSLAAQEYPNQHHRPTAPPVFAGKTLDFTLFAMTRALDAVLITWWTKPASNPRHHSQPPALSTKHPTLTSWLARLADPSIFAISAAIIMHSWFYTPERLPRSYNSWISTAAAIDPRLIEALRRARHGTFLYGVDTGQAPLLAPMCRDLHLPEPWGDPALTVPVPCALVHSGAGPSCERHALTRFAKSFVFALNLYLPLNVASRALAAPKSLRSRQALASLLRSSSRSAAFLASFIASFYYAVCLARTRLGPVLLGRFVTPQMWDSGLCVLAGCLACGWSVLVEQRAKRMELAFFVAPRALATLLPRVYDKAYIGRERAVFAVSVASVLSLIKAGEGRSARGVFGRVLEGVLKE